MSRKVEKYKLVILGDTAVGKSCIVSRFAKNKFYEFQEPTIGAAFLTQQLDLDNKIIKFEIWDTAGQERYRSLAPMYYRGAYAAIIVYDITCADSFAGAKTWITELKKKAKNDCIITLAGNKSDLELQRKVNKKDVEEYVKEANIFHLETSAKTAYNIQNLFEEIARKLHIVPKSESNYNLAEHNNIDYHKNSWNSCCNVN
jgi:small GTP-binding protein